MGFLKKIVGSRNDRILKSYQKILNKINSIGDELKSLALEDFPKITEKLKKEHNIMHQIWNCELYNCKLKRKEQKIVKYAL